MILMSSAITIIRLYITASTYCLLDWSLVLSLAVERAPPVRNVEFIKRTFSALYIRNYRFLNKSAIIYLSEPLLGPAVKLAHKLIPIAVANSGEEQQCRRNRTLPRRCDRTNRSVPLATP